MNTTLSQILLILVLVVLNGWFAAAEIALISARRAALKQRAEEGSVGARVALRLTEDPGRLLATVQIGITIIGFLASATAAVTLAKPLEAWLGHRGVPVVARLAGPLALLLVTLAISYLTLVLGELTPKRLGLQRAEGVAIAVSRPLSMLSVAAAPFVWLLTRSTDVAGLALGMKPGQGREGVSEEEIKLLVTEQGTLLDEEKRMITEIFELGDTVAREVMVPRVDMVSAEDTETVEAALSILRGSGFSRMPVFHEDRDRIVGVALLKDLVGPIAGGRGDECVTDHMREPVFVPETKPILPLLSEMQRTRNHLMIVVDEYGGTAGLVTIEDIVEEIIGEVADEFDRDRDLITDVRPGEWVIEGGLPIEDALALGLPVQESDEYDTLAGWVLAELGRIPALGERFAVQGHEFRVQQMRRRRISRLRVTRTGPVRTDESAEEGGEGSASA
jgi:putative hemolysin